MLPKLCFSFEPRKICRNCKCGQEEHDIPTSNEDDRKVGKLFEDTKYTTLIAKLKSDGIPMYKRNVMILTNPVTAKKNVSINTVTYEWAPPVQNQTLVRYQLRIIKTHMLVRNNYPFCLWWSWEETSKSGIVSFGGQQVYIRNVICK